MRIGIENKEQQCLECGQFCKNRRSLGNHLMRSHPTLGGQKAYVLKHMLNGVVPKCMCDCGEDVSWQKTTYEFGDYVSGHNSRVQKAGFCAQTYVSTPEQIEKRNKAIRDSYEKNSEEFSKRIGDAVSVAFKDPVKNKNLREGQKRGWAKDTARKRKLSERNVDMLAIGLIGPQAPFKVEWKHNPFTGQKELMHSSWESRFLDVAIEKNIPVTKDHGITIPYTGVDGNHHIYVPDFITLDKRTMFEVKGHEDEITLLKHSAARDWCSQRDIAFRVLCSVDEFASIGDT